MAWAKSQGLGGAFFWEFNGDTANGELVNAISNWCSSRPRYGRPARRPEHGAGGLLFGTSLLPAGGVQLHSGPFSGARPGGC
ncbi:hypothetical protein SMICM17S_07357 [Streptomyces microflavus]